MIIIHVYFVCGAITITLWSEVYGMTQYSTGGLELEVVMWLNFWLELLLIVGRFCFFFLCLFRYYINEVFRKMDQWIFGWNWIGSIFSKPIKLARSIKLAGRLYWLGWFICTGWINRPAFLIVCKFKTTEILEEISNRMNLQSN